MTFLLLLLSLSAAPARAAGPSITFLSGDSSSFTVTAAEMRAMTGARAIELKDPFYGKLKRYRAVPLRDLLTAAYGPTWVENGVGEFFFEAVDGYRSHAKASVLTQFGGMVAFADEDAPGWEEMPKEKTKPGPFYLVWLGAAQTPEKGFPWPWGIATVKTAILEDEYPKAVPRNVPPRSRAMAGWKVFKSRCISCHSISGQGGSVGPDLNEPRGITGYHDKKELKAFIRKASSFRHTKMPDFDDLWPGDLDDLMTYFDFISVQNGTKK